LRSVGRQGAAIADELIAFGNRKDWQMPLVELAVQCEAQVIDDRKTGRLDDWTTGRRIAMRTITVRLASRLRTHGTSTRSV